MMKLVPFLLTAAVFAAGLSAAELPAAASGARHFANCTQMHTVYIGGVARPGATDKRRHGGHAKYAPKVSAALYNANSGSDRDHDGIACEQ
ncbi:excalibur calcium-binding domain-containing protein [Motilibacter rhizosphaerae]|uniref:Excalibur calcium-binding domain-containing protein n=1 Tax=Motilibacter rhizosphaerae TaxID=598652 RepID=A0A4Q7NQM0_9ACTN|nr:excalibur calcium-binding domain-containing protein [Motilibacter rhizosphaerae]RZS86890.1 excalibur calcium-binding domain-containing protein [Motilibacter rhizosphaerae]